MKLTTKQIKQIIKEELKIVKEAQFYDTAQLENDIAAKMNLIVSWYTNNKIAPEIFDIIEFSVSHKYPNAHKFARNAFLFLPNKLWDSANKYMASNIKGMNKQGLNITNVNLGNTPDERIEKGKIISAIANQIPQWQAYKEEIFKMVEFAGRVISDPEISDFASTSQEDFLAAYELYGSF